MNKNAQAGPLAMIALVLIFLLNWAIWLGSWLNTVGKYTVETNRLTGVEAFAFSNLNMIVLFGVVFGLMAYMYFGVRR